METIKLEIINFLKNNLKEIIWLTVLLLFGNGILGAIVSRVRKFADDGDDQKESIKEKRAKTLSNIIITSGSIIIYSIILLMILSMFGIDLRPILAGVGILGLAIGFGAQSLVKDLVSGFFILAENQFNVGDRIKIGAFEGNVYKISLHSTVLIDDDKNKIYLPNGSINNVINYSQK